MKRHVKRMLAIVLAMLTVAALLPITVSADQNAIIVVELNEPYFGENLNEVLPEIKIEAAYPFIEGYAFTVYYAHTSDEDAYAAAAKLAKNPIVKNAAYCPGNPKEFTSRVGFSITTTDEYLGGYYGIDRAELGKLFPNCKIVRARGWARNSYDIYFDVASAEEWYALYDELKASPFLKEVMPYDPYDSMMNFVNVGGLTVTTKQKYTDDEFLTKFSYAGIKGIYQSYGKFNFSLYLSDATMKGTFDAVKKLIGDPDIANVDWVAAISRPGVLPTELGESDYTTPERPAATVTTALGALRIAAGLSQVKNNVYDYRLADALWQYDRDGDKAITVSDALLILREAARIE